jgi:DNA-binding response OmpR family regulator
MQPFSTRRVSTPVSNDKSPALALPGRRVLFVSGDTDLRAVVSRVLERESYQVHAVSHSGHAHLLCRTNEFDVLIAELSGPDISGPALAEQLRRLCPGLSVIFLGNPGTPEGVDHVLVRPFTRDDLLERLHGVLKTLAA